MSSKLVRTQLMLDKEVLDEIRPWLAKHNISLAQYVRDIMADKPKIKKTSKKQKFQRLLNSLDLKSLDPEKINESVEEGQQMRDGFTLDNF